MCRRWKKKELSATQPQRRHNKVSDNITWWKAFKCKCILETACSKDILYHQFNVVGDKFNMFASTVNA